MKVRFLRSGQTVLNGKHVTGADVCTVTKELAKSLVDSGKWEVVEETAQAAEPEQAEGQE